MARMHNPPHPGKVFREFLGGIDLAAAAKHLHVSRATLSRIRNGKAAISADMSFRLSAALGTHAEIWYELQTNCDLWQASQKKRPKIEPFHRAAYCRWSAKNLLPSVPACYTRLHPDPLALIRRVERRK